MDQPTAQRRIVRTPIETMAQSEADIEAGRVEDFDRYLARITQEAAEAVAEAERRRQAARA